MDFAAQSTVSREHRKDLTLFFRARTFSDLARFRGERCSVMNPLIAWSLRFFFFRSKSIFVDRRQNLTTTGLVRSDLFNRPPSRCKTEILRSSNSGSTVLKNLLTIRLRSCSHFSFSSRPWMSKLSRREYCSRSLTLSSNSRVRAIQPFAHSRKDGFDGQDSLAVADATGLSRPANRFSIARSRFSISRFFFSDCISSPISSVLVLLLSSFLYVSSLNVAIFENTYKCANAVRWNS